jgi:hypothetical protein
MGSITIKYSKDGLKTILDGFGTKLTTKEVKEFEETEHERVEERNKFVDMECVPCGMWGNFTRTKTGKLPREKCYSCGEKLTERIRAPHAKKDEAQVRRAVSRVSHEGFNKEQSEAFYQTSIEGSNRRINGVGGASHYRPMVPDMDFMVKNGVAKPMDGEKAQNAEKARREQVVKHVGNKKNFKVGRSNNTQSIK